MSKMPTVCHIIRTEQNADITVELRLLVLSGTTRPAGFSVLGQVPPRLCVHAFLGIDVAVDRFLADPQFCAFMDRAVADLLGRPIARQAVCIANLPRGGLT